MEMTCHTLSHALPCYNTSLVSLGMTCYYCRRIRQPFATLVIVFVIRHRVAYVAREKKSDTEPCTRNSVITYKDSMYRLLLSPTLLVHVLLFPVLGNAKDY